MRWIPCITLLVGWSLALAAPAAETVDFAHQVLPILRERCAECHTDGRYEGAVSFDTRAALLEAAVAEPGNSAQSILVDRITSDDPDYRMPPTGAALSAAEIDVLRRWIDAGLGWQEGFTFRSDSYRPPLEPRRPRLPPAEPGFTNPIDRIVFAYWADRGVSPPDPLGDAAFFRRVSLDLVGVLPPPGAIRSFQASTDPDKRRHLVRGLLADRGAYADHWLTFWNDLLRNDYEGTGYIDGGRKQITGWLYRALLENMPYDQFVRELVDPRPEAEGFARGIVWRGQVNASQQPALQYAQNVGQVFLGVNLKCASCHDSFVDDWKLTDAYGLAAIYSDEPLEMHRCDVPTGDTAEAHFLFPQLGDVEPQMNRSERLRRLAELMTCADNGRLTRTIVNRQWHRLLGRGIVQPVDVMAARPWSEDLLDYLAMHLAEADYDLQKTLELITTSRVYAAQTVAGGDDVAAEDYVFTGPLPKRMTAEQFVDAIWQITGIGPDQTDDDQLLRQPLAELGAAPRPFVRASLVEASSLMRTLGRPSREQVVTTRPTNLTTLQALELSNGQPLTRLLASGAARLLAEHPHRGGRPLCRSIFTAALSRPPSDEELSRLVEIAGGDRPTADRLADVLWCIVMLPEFQIIR